MNKLNLKIGQTITILKPNELVPFKITGKVVGYYYNNWAQHDNAIYLYIRRPRRKILDRIIIADETVFIFDEIYENMHRKELIEKTSNSEISRLHRIKKEDIQGDKLIFSSAINENFEVENDIERFIDLTGSYMGDNNISPRTALEDGGYINYIKTLLTQYNVNQVLEYVKDNEYNILGNCINKAIEYKWY